MRNYIIFSLTGLLLIALSIFDNTYAEAASFYPRYERTLTEQVYVVSVGEYAVPDVGFTANFMSFKVVCNSNFRLSEKISLLHPENLSLAECSRYKDNPGRNSNYGSSSKYYQSGESLTIL